MSEVASDLAYLVQTEFRLARTEIGEKVAAASNAGVWLGLGAGLAFAGLIVLLFDIARWLDRRGHAARVEPAHRRRGRARRRRLLAMVGVNRMRASELVPNRTLEQLREDYVTAKEHVR